MSARRTKICATVGPASSGTSVLERLVEAGAEIFRLNFSHGTPEEHARVLARIRQLERRAGKALAVLQDLQGPRLRLLNVPGGEARLEEGARIRLVGPKGRAGTAALRVTHEALVRGVRPGHRVLVRDGRVELFVESVRGQGVVARVVRGGVVRRGSGINVPDTVLDVPALTPKDRRDLKWGAEAGVDAVALSFVRDAQDIRAARRLLRRAGSRALLVAKIERFAALEHLDGILAEADGVIVARGDLGVECSLEHVPILQKEILRRAARDRRFAVTATEMLESMVESSMPTRAEVSDIANAVLDGTDVLMLSAETAIGKHPVESVEWMARVAARAEVLVSESPRRSGAESDQTDPLPSLARAAVELRRAWKADAVVTITANGRSASLVSGERPSVPILALVSDESVARALAFWSGVKARVAPRDVVTPSAALAWCRRRGWLRGGTRVVVLCGTGTDRPMRNTLCVDTVP